jgi:hypothetical protein
MAISSPLLENVQINGAQGVLINITGSSNMTLSEVNEAATLIQEAASESANIIFGSVLDERMGDSIRITVIATGFDSPVVSNRSWERDSRVVADSQNRAKPAERYVSILSRKRSEESPEATRADRPVIRVGSISDLEPEYEMPKAAQAGGADDSRKSSQSIRSRREGRSMDEYDIPTFLRRSAD